MDYDPGFFDTELNKVDHIGRYCELARSPQSGAERAQSRNVLIQSLNDQFAMHTFGSVQIRLGVEFVKREGTSFG